MYFNPLALVERNHNAHLHKVFFDVFNVEIAKEIGLNAARMLQDKTII